MPADKENGPLKYIVIFCICAVIMYLADLGCPIKLIFNTPCPTCGVTRAMVSLLTFDFQAYINHNVMAIPLTVSVMLMIGINKINKKLPVYIFVAITLSVNTMYYLCRVFNYDFIQIGI